MRNDYRTEKMQTVKVKGIECEFTDSRIDRKTLPEGKILYEIAGDDDCGDEPCRVSFGVLINFYGTLVCEQELPLGEDGNLWLSEGDFVWKD